jgi:hypothetical protein
VGGAGGFNSGPVHEAAPGRGGGEKERGTGEERGVRGGRLVSILSLLLPCLPPPPHAYARWRASVVWMADWWVYARRVVWMADWMADWWAAAHLLVYSK